MMNIVIVGSRYFGAALLGLCLGRGHTVEAAIAPTASDRLLIAARAAGIGAFELGTRRIVRAADIPAGTDIILAAHAHARIEGGALAKARHGGIGYHPSLLPRHRGIAAVEWTVLCRDPVAGGTIYHLDAVMDGGGIAFQDWCHVVPEETAEELWRRALCPLGLRLMAAAIDYLERHGALPSIPQEERFATTAPAA